ncbi:MAG TPA: hypothetical protein VK804_23260 [Bradyrhizobium sp.]|jgi:hypothetical protein|uniref:hypothetical protein n=1 Tax=Bradyrhizobium sp. TaxID=376 RepID=UPI002C3CF55D|nr:hypothetical protein [Bradyrhizobium sp.]HTB03398.1 hypothetical protein [Bradyrhizobium sp.]
MATLCFFEETIRDQGGKETMSLEIGRSSYYDEDSLYLKVDDKTIIVNRATATKIWEAVDGVATYLSLRI